MKSVYLLGTDHRFQRGAAHGVNAAVFDEFRQTIKKIIADYKIGGIAEEMHKEGLGTLNFNGESLPSHLARELRIRHAYCDPNKVERLKMKITTASQREVYWLERLREFDVSPVLFILGATHVESFECLLNAHEFKAHVLIPDWEPTPTLNR